MSDPRHLDRSVYLLAAIGFILALKGLSSPEDTLATATCWPPPPRRVAVGFTFAYPPVRVHHPEPGLTLAAMAVGAADRQCLRPG